MWQWRVVLIVVQSLVVKDGPSRWVPAVNPIVELLKGIITIRIKKKLLERT